MLPPTGLCFIQCVGCMLLSLCSLAFTTESQPSVYHTLPSLTYLFVFLLAFSVSSSTIKFTEEKDLIHLLISISLAPNSVWNIEGVHKI